jgi:hypothetical protein
MYSEKTAPNSATEATMVAASRNGDEDNDIDMVEEISNKTAVASKIRRSSTGMALFVPITNSSSLTVLFKRILVNLS